MRISAGSAGSGDQVISETPAIAEQPRDREPMRFIAMLADATFGAFVAARAQIHVEDQDALTFVEALIHPLSHQRIGVDVAAERSERLLDKTTSKRRKLAHHSRKSARPRRASSR